MKKVIAIAVLGLFLFGANSTYAKTLKLAAIDWCPQLCSDKVAPGYVTDIVNLIFNGSPYQVEISTYPWSRAIKLVEAGHAHALLSPAKEEAPTLLFPEQEIGLQRMVFFTKKSSYWKFTGPSSLNGKHIGLAADVSTEGFGEFVSSHKDQFQTMPYNDVYLANSFKKLAYDRIDAFVFTYNSTVFEMNKLGITSKFKPAGVSSKSKIYIAFTPSKSKSFEVKKMMAYYDKKMRELKKSGKIKDIMKKYGLEDWQQFL